MSIVVTFDIADQSFSVYSMKQWEVQVKSWADELWEDENIEFDWEEDWDEIVEAMYGNELFFEVIEGVVPCEN